jgi:NAD-dependent deacetylase
LKARSAVHPDLVYHWPKDISVDDTCERGCPLRPDIVWFGELVPNMERGIDLVKNADKLIIIGTSLQVYPAAGLIDYYNGSHPITYIDPKPSTFPGRRFEWLAQPASIGVPALAKQLMKAI